MVVLSAPLAEITHHVLVGLYLKFGSHVSVLVVPFSKATPPVVTQFCAPPNGKFKTALPFASVQ
jgi:hypothetical protein